MSKRKDNRTRWSEGEVERLRTEWDADIAVKAIARALGRSPWAITKKAQALALPSRADEPWSDSEEVVLRARLRDLVKEFGALFDRAPQSVVKRAIRLMVHGSFLAPNAPAADIPHESEADDALSA